MSASPAASHDAWPSVEDKLSRIAAFDFVVLLIIGESTPQALLGNDFSIVNAWIVVATLVHLDFGLAALTGRWPAPDPPRTLHGISIIPVTSADA